jgi:hypothetical protein
VGKQLLASLLKWSTSLLYFNGWHTILNLTDWLDDKEWWKFIWPAICKANNFIPIDVWLTSENHDNVGEGLHSAINQTGKSRTLLGALEVGLAYDLHSEQSRQVQVDHGIMPSFLLRGVCLHVFTLSCFPLIDSFQSPP